MLAHHTTNSFFFFFNNTSVDGFWGSGNINPFPDAGDGVHDSNWTSEDDVSEFGVDNSTASISRINAVTGPGARFSFASSIFKFTADII